MGNIFPYCPHLTLRASQVIPPKSVCAPGQLKFLVQPFFIDVHIENTLATPLPAVKEKLFYLEIFINHINWVEKMVWIFEKVRRKYAPECTILFHFFKNFPGEAPRTPAYRRGQPPPVPPPLGTSCLESTLWVDTKPPRLPLWIRHCDQVTYFIIHRPTLQYNELL